MKRKQSKSKIFSLSNANKLWIALSLMLLGFILSLFSRYMDGFADGYYTYVYRYLSVVLAFVFNLFPFSVAEICIYLLCFVFIGTIVYGVFVVSKKKGIRKTYWLKVGTNTLLTMSVLFFLFIVFCGINYQRTSFAQKEHFSVKQYGTDELQLVCEYLTDEINSLKEKDLSFTGIREESRIAMNNLSHTYTSLQGYYPKPKYLLFSEVLSYQQISGVYSFFTVEANYNGDMPLFLQPFTMCHELAHLKGIMREEEASFVAYLACRNSGNSSLWYSAAISAYSLCMSELYSYDNEVYNEIRDKLCDGANADIKKKNTFWQQYEGTISRLQSKVNDAYLKANSQASGVSSYNEVVSLIVNDYINNNPLVK